MVFRGKISHMRNVLIVAVSVAVVTMIFRLTEAGSLTPSAPPAGTMNSLGEIYAPLASSGYDSLGVVGSKNGNALQIAKCIISKITGGTPCP